MLVFKTFVCCFACCMLHGVTTMEFIKLA